MQTGQRIGAIIKQARGGDSRRTFLDGLGLSDVHTQHAHRWEHGDVRPAWVPALADRGFIGREDALSLLAERLDVSAGTAARLAVAVAHDGADDLARLLARALNLGADADGVATVKAWCNRATPVTVT